MHTLNCLRPEALDLALDLVANLFLQKQLWITLAHAQLSNTTIAHNHIIFFKKNHSSRIFETPSTA